MRRAPRQVNRLRATRAAVEPRLTQRDTAILAKIPLSRYWLIENGYRDAAPIERRRLARLFGVEESALFPPSAAPVVEAAS